MFKCRDACSKIKDDKTKIQWCRSVIRNVGRILKGLPEGAQWRKAKEKLWKYLGEEYPKTAAWKKLRGYKAKGKCFVEIASDVRELAIKAADEEDVQERLAVEVFLRAIPWHFAQEIRVKQIESLEEALEEAKLRKVLEEEEDGKRKVQAVTKDPRPARQKEGNKVRENRRSRKGPACWGCGEERYMLKNCILWKDFKKGMCRKKEVRVKLERGPLGTYVAPA